jgi:hypothetical protein
LPARIRRVLQSEEKVDAFDPCQHHGLGNSFETADSDKENVELYGEGETHTTQKNVNYMTRI